MLISSALTAQSDSMYVSTEVENEIYSIDFISSKERLFLFLKSHNIRVQNQRDSKKEVKVTFTTDEQTYKAYDLLIGTLGYSTMKKVNAISNFTQISEINLELDYLKKKRESYIELIEKLDEKSENYLEIWNEQKRTEEHIFLKERELIKLREKENTFTVSLDLNDELTSMENTRVSFVNMPGVEYSFLSIESPKVGLSADNYQGYFLKYLFTKGKSYGTIGVYKNSDIGEIDSTAFSEMFVLGFGQDFYSRHLGRGTRKFLNLYSGYTIGGILATGKTKKSEMFYIAPSIGIEIYKNKYFLIDTKANYFVPFSHNRNLRGVSYNASFNFVF